MVIHSSWLESNSRDFPQSGSILISYAWTPWLILMLLSVENCVCLGIVSVSPFIHSWHSIWSRHIRMFCLSTFSQCPLFCMFPMSLSWSRLSGMIWCVDYISSLQSAEQHNQLMIVCHFEHLSVWRNRGKWHSRHMYASSYLLKWPSWQIESKLYCLGCNSCNLLLACASGTRDMQREYPSR